MSTRPTLLSGLATAAAALALGVAAGALGLALVPAPPPAFTTPERAPPRAPDRSADIAPADWPALFGTLPPPAPAPEPEPVPEPVVEAPPEENFNYILTGLVVGDGGSGWAMIAENDRGLVVRVGDELVGGERVVSIDARGVWLDDGGARQLIPVQKQDLGGLVWTDPPDPAVALPDTLLGEVTIPVESATPRALRELIEDAGALILTETPEGASALRLASIRPGGVFAQMGLRVGDTILRVNGEGVVTPRLIPDTSVDNLSSGALSLEIIRDGVPNVVNVRFDTG